MARERSERSHLSPIEIATPQGERLRLAMTVIQQIRSHLSPIEIATPQGERLRLAMTVMRCGCPKVSCWETLG